MERLILRFKPIMHDHDKFTDGCNTVLLTPSVIFQEIGVIVDYLTSFFTMVGVKTAARAIKARNNRKI